MAPPLDLPAYLGTTAAPRRRLSVPCAEGHHGLCAQGQLPATAALPVSCPCPCRCHTEEGAGSARADLRACP